MGAEPCYKSGWALTDPEFAKLTTLDESPNFTNRYIQAFLNKLATMGLGLVQAVPEPSTFALLACGGLAALVFCKRRKS